VALTEIAVGVLVTTGLLVRAAASVGLALNLVLFLTATWHTAPYFLGSDIAFVFAWLPFVLVGAEGQPALEHRPADARLYTRRVTLAGFALAGLTFFTRGRYVPPPPPGTRVASASAVRPGEAITITAPGGPALLVRSADGGVSGFGATCTHAGCEVGWSGGTLVCPCHGAEFDSRTGAPTRGPAREPLPVLDVRERDGQLYLV
jgi:nitrite reductase/ring-hydroxylating ferredoxin subunit